MKFNIFRIWLSLDSWSLKTNLNLQLKNALKNYKKVFHNFLIWIGGVQCKIATGDNGKTAWSVAKKWSVLLADGYYKIDLEEKPGYDPMLRCEFIETWESTSPSMMRFTEDILQEDNDTDEEGEDVPLMQSASTEKRMNNNSSSSQGGKDIENNYRSCFQDMMTR